MTNNNIHTKNNIINNTGVASNKIKLSMYKGLVSGNIVDESYTPDVFAGCELPNTLDFSCSDNSQYIGLL